jgi:hypothetical protein
MTKLNNMCKVCGQTPCNCTSVTEAGVGNRMSDMSVGSPKIVYKNGRAVGEIGIDHDASPGNGPYYMKHYETNTSYSGYDTKKEALAELKHCVEQMNEQGVAEGLPKAQDGRYNPDGSKKQAWHKDPRWQQHAKDLENDPKNIYGGVGKKKVKEQGVAEGADERKRNALWAQITSYEKRAKETTNDIKKDHLMKMADELRAKLPTTDEEKLAETLNDLAEAMGTELEEAPGAETLGHNQSTVASNLNSLDLDEGDKKPEQPEQPEADYGDDYQAMVKRMKQLAGAGPLKTVYDPAKRVYRNIPTATQPKK